MPDTKIKLTQFAPAESSGRVTPAGLQQILARMSPGLLPPQLLAGMMSGDPAAVYQINPQQAIVAATDFCTPILDEPRYFGAIAATQAISNIYAMGGTPLFALALLGLPTVTLPPDVSAEILQAGAEVCRAAGIVVAGTQTIASTAPVYGLLVIGIVNPAHLKRHAMARPGDKLILGKPLGSGVYASGHKQGRLHESDHAALLESALQLNTPGPVLACLDGVHAMTDVGGQGLLGHVLEICRGSQLHARLDFSALPLLPRALDLLQVAQGCPALLANWASYGHLVSLASACTEAERALLGDPQTAGGLLVSCAPASVTEVLSVFLQQGFSHVSVIGELAAGAPGVDIC